MKNNASASRCNLQSSEHKFAYGSRNIRWPESDYHWIPALDFLYHHGDTGKFQWLVQWDHEVQIPTRFCLPSMWLRVSSYAMSNHKAFELRVYGLLVDGHSLLLSDAMRYPQQALLRWVEHVKSHDSLVSVIIPSTIDGTVGTTSSYGNHQHMSIPKSFRQSRPGSMIRLEFVRFSHHEQSSSTPVLQNYRDSTWFLVIPV
jgi:hypothetical protein